MTMDTAEHFFKHSWCAFDYDPALTHWVTEALPHAHATLTNPDYAQWWRYQNTWFVGVDALPNNHLGAIGNSGSFSGVAADFIHNTLKLPNNEYHPAQVSVCYPGYPQPMEGESEAVFRYRHDRDGAHVDGLRIVDHSTRKRSIQELHTFVLGIPMNHYHANAAPFAVWEGSHSVIRDGLREFLSNVPRDQWSDVDITIPYQQARQHVFDTCKRIEIHTKPGEAFMAHRLSVHGIAPWKKDATNKDDMRMICYFRPVTYNIENWLLAD